MEVLAIDSEEQPLLLLIFDSLCMLKGIIIK